jgi:hypothetical protein
MKMINLLKKKKKKRVFVIILHLNYLINFFLCCFVILLRLDFVIYQIFWLNLFFIDSLPYVLRSFFLRFIFPLPYQIFFSHSSFICFGAVVFEFFTFLLWLFLYFFSIYSWLYIYICKHLTSFFELSLPLVLLIFSLRYFHPFICFVVGFFF